MALMLMAASMVAKAVVPESHKYEIERDMPLFLDSISVIMNHESVTKL